MQKVNFASYPFSDFGKCLDHWHLCLGRQHINKKIDDGDLTVNDRGFDASFIIGVEENRFSSILLQRFALFVRANKGVKLVVSGEFGAAPAGEEGSTEISGGAGDEDVVRHNGEERAQ